MRHKLLSAVPLILTGAANGQSVYFADFNDGTAPGFTNARFTQSPDGTRRVLGKYGNETARLTLDGLMPGRLYVVTANIYAFDSWDGSTNSAHGPDFWTFRVGDRLSWTTTFSAFDIYRQSFPSAFGEAENPPGTGGVRCDCGWRCWEGRVGPWIYPLRITFAASSTREVLEFSAERLTPICDESWGLDDVAVTGDFCLADFNDDGGIDAGDVAAFFEAWEGGVPQGDVNADGGIDGLDLFHFFDHWQSGC